MTFSSFKTKKREISDVHEMDIYSLWYFTLSLLKFPLSVVKGIFFTFLYFIKALVNGILWLKWRYFQVVEYLSEYYLGFLFWIPTTLLTFVKVKFSWKSHSEIVSVKTKGRLTPRLPQQNKAQAVARPVSGRFNFTKFAHL